MTVSSIYIRLKISNCGECDHVQHLRNFGYPVCSHPDSNKDREASKCSINRMVDPPVFNPGVPNWCPLINSSEEQVIPKKALKEIAILKADLALVTADRNQLLEAMKAIRDASAL